MIRDIHHDTFLFIGRYFKYQEILGRGAYKTVYKGFDGEEGELDGLSFSSACSHFSKQKGSKWPGTK